MICDFNDLIEWFAKNFYKYEVMINFLKVEWNWMEINRFQEIASYKNFVLYKQRAISGKLNMNYRYTVTSCITYIFERGRGTLHHS